MNYSWCLVLICFQSGLLAAPKSKRSSDHVSAHACIILYQKALETCTHIWSQVEQLSECSSPTLSESQLFVLDAAAGRLLYLVLCFKGLRSDSQLSLCIQDIVYLLTMLKGLSDRYDDLFVHFAEFERMITTKHVLHNLHQQLLALRNRHKVCLFHANNSCTSMGQQQNI